MSDTDEISIIPVETPWTNVSGSSRAFRDVHLRLLMKEREDLLAKLVEVEYAIWELEECFRAKP